MRNTAFGAFVVLCLLGLIWPGYSQLGNRIEPRVFGLPFSLFWNVILIALSFFALLAYDLTDPRRKGKDA